MRLWPQTRPDGRTPERLIVRASGEVRTQALLPVLRAAAAHDTRELVLCGAPRRSLVHTHTLGDLERFEQCALTLALRPEGAPMPPLTRWSDVAAVAENGARTFSVSVASPEKGQPAPGPPDLDE